MNWFWRVPIARNCAFELQTLVCFAYSGAFLPTSKSASQQQASLIILKDRFIWTQCQKRDSANMVTSFYPDFSASPRRSLASYSAFSVIASLNSPVGREEAQFAIYGFWEVQSFSKLLFLLLSTEAENFVCICHVCSSRKASRLLKSSWILAANLSEHWALWIFA